MRDIIELKLKSEIVQIAKIIGIDNKDLFNVGQFDKKIFAFKGVINEYHFGRVYALAELYFEIFKEINPFGEFVELIVSYDLENSNN